jgi:hypothetical protein
MKEAAPMPDRILRTDEQHWRALREAWVRMPADQRAADLIHETDRRLVVIAAMRTLYCELRGDKGRVASYRQAQPRRINSPKA